MGWTVVISVIIHEAPQEMSDFLVLVQAGLYVSRGVLLLFVCTQNLLSAGRGPGAHVLVSF